MIATDMSVLMGVSQSMDGPFQFVLMFSCVCNNLCGQRVKQEFLML